MYKMVNGVPEYVIHWEKYDKLYYQGNFDQLIQLQKAYVKKHPEDFREKLLLADAYSYAGKYRSALKILKRLHRFNPYDTEFTHALVECLDHLNLDPKSFQWSREVPVFEDNPATLDWCYNYLRKEGVSDDAFNMLFEMESIGYARFDEVGLIKLLRKDDRFRVHELKDEEYPLIELTEWAYIELPDGLNTIQVLDRIPS